MRAYAQTDTGRVRKINQDSVFASVDPVGPLSNLFIVADGMGGHKAGDFASKFVAESMVRYLENAKGLNAVAAMRMAIERTNYMLYEEGKKDPDKSGMGSTLVAAAVMQNTLYVANVGDSRLYLLRDQLLQVTRDHSLVEEMVALGKMERNSDSYRNQKNIITRAMGIGWEVEPDFFEITLKECDCVLLCSDGLSNMVEDEGISRILRTTDTLKEKTIHLIEKANENGGRDNIAVILLEPQISEVSLC